MMPGYRIILLIMLVALQGLVMAQPPNKPTAWTYVPVVTSVPPPGNYSAGVTTNYVKIKEALGPINNTDSLDAKDYQQVLQTTQYLDGLGRPLQTVVRQVAPSDIPRDLVTPVVYDSLGRESYKYLPYAQLTGSDQNDGSFKLDAFNVQKSYFSNYTYNKNHGIDSEKVYYGRTVYEASPLNRVLKIFAPGNGWAGTVGFSNEHGTSFQYLVNTITDSVRIWNITDDTLTYVNKDLSTNIPTSATSFGISQLFKNVTIDEQGNSVVEYKDKDDKIILKKLQASSSPTNGHYGWLCTYYVYDDLGRLRFVIPPKAVEYAQTNNWSLSTTVIDELCYRYEYDAKGRAIAKKVPGADWVYMVYDKRDRVTYSQHSNMRAANQWMVTLYDNLNRPKMTGMVTYNGTRTQLQQWVDNNFNTSYSYPTLNANMPSAPDLLVPTRAAGITQYKASQSISFTEEFESEGTAEFETLFDTSSVNKQIVVHNNPIPTGANFVALSITYYDDYSFATGSYSTTNSSKLDAGDNAFPETLPSAANMIIRGMVTGTAVRMLENAANLSQGSWLHIVNYYDSKGRLVQVQSDNCKTGKDTLTSRFNFTGKIICTYAAHKNPAASTAIRIKTNFNYDYTGKLTNVKKTINDKNTDMKTILQNEYDGIGQLKTKLLGKNQGGTAAMDTISYEYNIRGWLSAINKDFNKIGGIDSRWFGMELNYNWGFDSLQYGGNISGMKWRSKGDGERRSYGFGYDRLNRLLYADFNQYGGTWTKAAGIDFSMQMGDGVNYNTAYDANGNILKMRQMGLKLTSSSTIDSLNYIYFSSSNKLQKVNDGIMGDNKLGDFTDNNSGDDYGYDANGNMVTDKNKRINGSTGIDIASANGAIQYNHLNLPWRISLKDSLGNPKGTITYLYDALGNKLRKTVNDTVGHLINITDYTGSCVYQNDTLQYIGMEEGRIRPKKINNADTVYYDYFVKDHLGNIRMVLTDQQQLDQYPSLTFEDQTSPLEQLFYENATSAITSRPGGFFDNSNNGDKVQLLRKSTQSIGGGKLLKVMATDKLHIKVDYYAANETTDNSPAVGTLSILDALPNLINSNATTVPLHGQGNNISDYLSNYVPFLTFLAPTVGTGGAMPKAYLNILFFDEQFKFVGQNSEIIQVTTKGSGQHIYRVTNDAKVAPRNGYAWVFVSNESNNLVYFDNLQVTHERGPIEEENHYYPFGLTMSHISSKALAFGNPQNTYKFNGIEQNNDFDLNSYDAQFRNLDPQIGRFWQIDPKPNEMQSSFTMMENNPIRYLDPLGDTLRVTTKDGAFLFNLNDGRNTMTTLTAKQLYERKIQWFEPLANNYMPIISMNNNIGQMSQLKHFTWQQIDEFASKDRWMVSYRQGGSGDWKALKSGADGYLMVTVGGQPYWADAIGNIPFAVDYFTDRLAKHGDERKAIKETINKGRDYGEGKVVGGERDKSNNYDIYFVLRGALYASDKYEKTYEGVRSVIYIPSNLGNRIWYKDAIPFLGLGR